MTRGFLFSLGLLGAVGWPAATALHGQPADTGVVDMPPLVVEETHGNQADWTYAKSDGCEFLSLCSEERTRRFIDGIYRARRMLQLLIPDTLQVHLTVPTEFILYPASKEKAVSSVVLEKMRLTNPGNTTGLKVRYMPTLRVDDPDASEVFVILNDDVTSQEDDSFLSILPGYAEYFLGNSTPTPPSWLFVGLIDLYRTGRVEPDELSFQPLPWTSEAAGDALRADAEAPRALLPLAQVFQAEAPALGDDAIAQERRAVWRAEAVLFVRWAHDGENAERIAAFRRFALRACHGPVNEADFRACFGLGYAEMRDELSDYLPTAVGNSFSLTAAEGDPPFVPIQTASKVQIWRIRGDWERRAGNYIRPSYPAVGEGYDRQARESFEKGLAAGQADPALDASAGIFAYEQHDFARAQACLVRATQAGAVRPDAYLDLARLLFAEARKSPQGSDGHLSFAQENSIGAVIVHGLAFQPQTAALFGLLSDLEVHSDRGSPDAYLPLLDRGARLYPGFVELAFRAAVLEYNGGNRAEAEWLVGVTIARRMEPPLQERFRWLRAQLAQDRQP